MDNDKIISSLKVTGYDFDPDSTSVTDVAWVDMRDIYSLLVMFFRNIGTSAITLTILANTDSDGGGDEATIKTKVFTAGQPNAVGDYGFLEALAQQVAQAGSEDGKDYRYVSSNISFATNTDEGTVVYIARPRFKFENLTADSIATS